MTCRILRAEEDVFVLFHLISVVDPKLFFSDPDPTFQEILNPAQDSILDPT